MPTGRQGDDWQGYKLWRMDIHECPGCGFQLAAGFAPQPIGKYDQPDYLDKVKACDPIVRIDDCAGTKP